MDVFSAPGERLGRTRGFSVGAILRPKREEAIGFGGGEGPSGCSARVEAGVVALLGPGRPSGQSRPENGARPALRHGYSEDGQVVPSTSPGGEGRILWLSNLVIGLHPEIAEGPHTPPRIPAKRRLLSQSGEECEAGLAWN